MEWKKEKVLVTGGGGFLGSHIIKELQKKNCSSIRIFCRTPHPEIENTGIEVFNGDLRNASAVEKACESRSIIFHVAAKAGIWGKKEDFFGINLTGTQNVINACKKFNVPVMVYTSSPSVAYPPTKDIINADEKLLYPESFLAYYPETKAAAEKSVLEANSVNFATAALRPHLIWGPGDPHLLPRLIAKARSRRLMEIGDGHNKVDLTYVENAAAAHLLAAENLRTSQSAKGKSYFISDDAPVNLWEWINTLLEKCDIQKINRKISYEKAYKIGVVLEFIFKMLPFLGEPPMTRFIAGQLAFSHFFDISAAKKDFGYKPVTDQEEAMTKTVNWLKNEIV